MKKLVVLVCLLTFGLTQAQNVKPTYEMAGDLVKVTYFYKNGNVKQQGFFTKSKKITGTWTSYNIDGNKTAIARYKSGKKVGKWTIWNKDEIKEITYKNNAIASVKTSFNDSGIAIK